MRLSSLPRAIGSRLYYLVQRSTRFRFDAEFEQRLRRDAERYLASRPASRSVDRPVRRLADLKLEDEALFSVHRGDIYRRFLAEPTGPDRDRFGRPGRWIPRGCIIYVDNVTGEYVKIFDDYFCSRGEGRFLTEALQRGVYDFLCPGLSYLVRDGDNNLRGYAVASGKPLSRYEFERYVGGALRRLVEHVTATTGLYFYDLEFHNVIRHGDLLSVIDLESVLPVEWFGQGRQFSVEHFSDIDVGWPIQSKWNSPRWYRTFLRDLKAGRSPES